jgi:PPM family protein phosphatase
LLCTDGVWANLSDQIIATFYSALTESGQAKTADLKEALAQLGQRAVTASAPFSDNSTAAVIRYIGP